MTIIEKKRFIETIEKVYRGQVNELPKFIKDSISEGLSSLVDNLEKTSFME